MRAAGREGPSGVACCADTSAKSHPPQGTVRAGYNDDRTDRLIKTFAHAPQAPGRTVLCLTPFPDRLNPIL